MPKKLSRTPTMSPRYASAVLEGCVAPIGNGDRRPLQRPFHVVRGDAPAAVEDRVRAQAEGVGEAVGADRGEVLGQIGTIARSVAASSLGGRIVSSPPNTSTMYSAESASPARCGSMVTGSPLARRRRLLSLLLSLLPLTCRRW